MPKRSSSAPALQLPQSNWHNRISPLALAVIVLLLIAMYAVIPFFGKFANTYPLLKSARPAFLILAAGLTVATYLIAACTYTLLALHRLSFRRTLSMQLVSSFVNRILPAGTGGAAVNIQYLRHSKHTTAQAAVVVAVNNLLGLIGNALLILVAVIANSGHREDLPSIHLRLHHLGIATVIIVAVCILAAHFRLRLHEWMIPVIRNIKRYHRRPRQLTGALMTSLALSLSNTLILWSVAHSLGAPLTILQAVIAMSFATIFSVLIPTPGGVGGAEAGITSALVAIHIDYSASLAIALLYRLFTFWLPLLLGGIALKFNLKYL